MELLLKIEIGKTYGDMICVGHVKSNHYNDLGKLISVDNLYVMKCTICGREKNMKSSTIRLRKGITHKSCGKGLKTVNMYFYDRWRAMRTRTTNMNYAHTDRYVERGINSEEFKYFIDFYDSMYCSFKKLADKIGPENTSLERIDINKNYTKENCKWIDVRDQQKNTSKTIYFEAIYPNGTSIKRNDLTGFCKENNISYSSAVDCICGRAKTAKRFKFKRIQKDDLNKV